MLVVISSLFPSQLRIVLSHSHLSAVEYSDPSDLFPDTEPLFVSILPLRNLHWKTPNRPLRSIDSVFLDFAPARPSSPERPHARNPLAGGDALSSPRRHQIPGLKQTPYVKLYLLRCDNHETYKTTSRKLVREWVKKNITSARPPSHRNSIATGVTAQDNHNACEYLIVHVVEEGVDVLPTTSYWPSLSTTTIVDRLKADFNGTSKNSIDRVVQLRLPRGGLNNNRTSELNNQLSDLVAKLKSVILSTFTRRVLQYEEGIRAKAAQRNLPGWNFCTFFILKEGLIFGFEHVGLYDDALLAYDELVAGLDETLQEQTVNDNETGVTFLQYTEDVVEKAKKIIEEGEPADGNGVGESQSPIANYDRDCVAIESQDFLLNERRKPYREMILENKISLFDLRVYIFSRQMKLLLGAAKLSSAKQQRSASDVEPSLDPAVLAEICKRASHFLSIASLTLRHELQKGLAVSGSTHDTAFARQVVDDMISSWVYSAASQVLLQTKCDALSISNSVITLNGGMIPGLNAALEDSVDSEAPFTPNAPTSPTRPFSIATSISSPPGSSSGHSTLAPPTTFNSRPSSISSQPLNLSLPKTGVAKLASTRGEIFCFAKRTLENLGQRFGLAIHWSTEKLLYDLNDLSPTASSDVSLDDTVSARDENQFAQTVLHSGIKNPVLRNAIRSQDDFDVVYEQLIGEVFRHHYTGGRARSAHMALAQLAFLKYRFGDFAAAENYFVTLADFYADQDWIALECVFLEALAKCRKILKKEEDYVNTLIRLLTNYISTAQSNDNATKLLAISCPAALEYFAEVISLSEKFSKPVIVPLFDFFGGFSLDSSVSPIADNNEGMLLKLRLRFLLGQTLQIEGLKVHLSDAWRDSDNVLSFYHREAMSIGPSSTVISAYSPKSVHGKYLVDHIELQVGNVVFSHDYKGLQSFLASNFSDTEYVDSLVAESSLIPVSCFPPAHGLQAKITPTHRIDLSLDRTLDIEIRNGQNDVSQGICHIKSLLDGFILDTSAASLIEGDLIVTPEATAVSFNNLAKCSFARISIPFFANPSINETVEVKLELAYETAKGQSFYMVESKVELALPISVNVQDTFRFNFMLSTYTIRPELKIPIRLFDCQIPGTPQYDVQSSLASLEPFDVFPEEPASIVFKTIPRKNIGETDTNDGPLSRSNMYVEFVRLDDECLATIEDCFMRDITASEFFAYSRLLLPHLLHTFASSWTAGDLAVIGLLREVEVFSFEEAQWLSVLQPLLDTTRKKLIAWLEKWHTVS